MFASFMQTVPPLVRLLLAILITVGITVFMVRIMHDRLVALSEVDDEAKRKRKRLEEAGEEDLPPLPPETYNLSGRVLSLLGTGFVFLLAFTLGQLWGASSDARTATQTEVSDWARASMLAKSVDGGDPIVQALEQYRASVTGEQWNALERADGPSASQAQMMAGQKVSQAVFTAEPQLSKTPEWPQLTQAVEDMLSQAHDRIDALPNPAAPGVFALIFILGITNLAMTAVFQPSRLGTNMFLMGLMATITAIMLFVVVEASNPFVGAAAVTPSGF